jgi:hypothetical protein
MDDVAQGIEHTTGVMALPDIATKNNPGCASPHSIGDELERRLICVRFGAAGNQYWNWTVMNDVTETILAAGIVTFDKIGTMLKTQAGG